MKPTPAPAPTGPVSVIDPSLFTAPYDAALVRGLRGIGIDATLVGRPLRDGEAAPDVPFRPVCYRWSDGAARRLGTAGVALKAAEHAADGLRLALAGEGVAHVQWLPFPAADALLLRLRRRRGPVVITVHDTTPFNGDAAPALQVRGLGLALAAADRLIVHTADGARRLAAAGVAAERVAVVPHGPLPCPAGAVTRTARARFTLVAFGKLRPYKGLETLVAALARLDRDTRDRLRVIVAGEPMMDLRPLRDRIAGAGLGATVELVPRRFDEDGMRALFDTADGFVFPYRAIEASGVFFLVQGLGRWIIASRLGAFAEALDDGLSGRLVPPDDVDAWAAALAEAARLRRVPTAAPRVETWETIARATASVYAAAWRDWRGRRAAPVPALASP